MAIKKEKIRNFLNDQIAQAEFRAKAYVFDEDNKRRPQRSIFVKIRSYFEDFFTANKSKRWITLTGLRGAGKTTLMYQLYHESKVRDCYRLILSLDQVTQIMESNISEVLQVYEEVIGCHLENLDKPLLLFLDEVQYDPKWGVALKSVYDRSDKVFIFVTGSAALHMNSNTDIARRTIFEKLFPLSFTEYLKIKNKKFPIKGLSGRVRGAIFASDSAKQCFEELKAIEKHADKYYMGTTRIDFQKYLNYGSLPFMIALQNEAIVYDQISKTLDRVVNNDIAQLGNFSQEVVSVIPAILYAVADMDAFNFSTISNKFGLSRAKVAEIFSILEQTEILFRVYPHGSHLSQSVHTTKKPSKYLFSSPAFRMMYYKMIGSIISEQNTKGRLLEDLAGMYLHRFLYKNTYASLTYDSAKGGADFILTMHNKRLVIEVGSGKKGYRQVIETAKKVKASYSIIVSENELEFSEEFNAVKIPIRLFVLM
ncbi:MAG: AAA family ATPase [Candidatus Moranbacteria bacterium]|nr:AAA family ATPase [Candidatus Moranbacteria bacterium]